MTVDVAIVGYGPVGQLLAILLAQRGWKVAVLERWPSPYPLPRAVHFDHEIARVLQGAGVMNALAGTTEAASVYEWRNAVGEVLIRFGRDTERSLSGWPESTMFCQPELERALDERARSLPSVSVTRGAEVVELAAGPDGVRLRANRDDGGPLEVRARFAVGCDGANSFVRERIGSGWHDLGFHFDWLVVDVLPSDPRQGLGAWRRASTPRPAQGAAGERSRGKGRKSAQWSLSVGPAQRAAGERSRGKGRQSAQRSLSVGPAQRAAGERSRGWEGPLNWQLCDPARPTTLVSGGRGRRRWEFMRLPHETLDELNREETAWRLLASWNVTPGNAKLERHAVYTFRARWADSWRAGRVLIAGDAAHQMPPFAGQGMCSGLRDAANLAWKLDLVLAGRASEALLDSYASERAPHVMAMIELSVALGRVICVADPEEARARDRRMVEEARERRSPLETQLPPLGPGCWLSGSPSAGRLFVQDQVRCGGRSGLFDDVVGRGFALVSPRGDPCALLDHELGAWFASLGGIRAHVAPGAAVDDLNGGYARWFEKHGAAVALVRPDAYVFGSAPRLEEAGALVRALRERLGPESPASAAHA